MLSLLKTTTQICKTRLQRSHQRIREIGKSPSISFPFANSYSPLFINNFISSFPPSGLQNFSSIARRHSRSKTMCPKVVYITRLKRAFHNFTSSSLKNKTANCTLS